MSPYSNPQRQHVNRAVRRLVVSLVVIALAVGGMAPAVDAQATRPSSAAQAENEFLHLLNQTRRANGLAPLASNAALTTQARSWSRVMASQDRLFHTSTLASDTASVVPGWQRAGENVGRGWSVSTLHQAFWNSKGHRDNMLGDFTMVGIGVHYTPQRTWVTFRFAKGPTTPPVRGTGAPQGNLWLADQGGRVHAYGTAGHHGDRRGQPLNRPIVGMIPTAAGNGYWLLGEDGGVFSFGDAAFYGSTGGMRLNQPVNGIAATRSGRGYWLVASDGGIFTFGDAAFYGSTGGMRLNQPVNGMAATSSGRGYWLVASDGGIFTFGDAAFYGSVADGRLGGPTVGIASTPDSRGYLIASSNGRVAAFGNAVHRGDARDLVLPAPISRIEMTPDGGGYWLVGMDGQVYPYGNAGSRISAPLPTSGGVIAVAAR